MLAVKAVKNKKEAAILGSQLTLKQVNQEKQKPVPASDSETIAVKQIIEGLAKQNKLDMPMYVKGSKIIVGQAAPADKSESSAHEDVPAAQTPTGQKKDSTEVKPNLSVLRNYEGMLKFLNAIAGIPYIIEYDGGCIGVECTEGFELSLVVKKLPA
jgi:hypothetical protein